MPDTIDITDIIGKYGKWQKMLTALLLYISVFTALNNLNLPFLAPNINHWCKRPSGINMSILDWGYKYIPPHETNRGKLVFSKCEMYAQDVSKYGINKTLTVPCTSWEYDHSAYPDTIIEKWSLVCDNSWKRSLVGSVYFIGNLVAAFVFCHLAERFGRRPIIMCGVVIHLIFGIVCIISPYYWLFALFRFLLSVGKGGCYITTFILAVEAVGIEYRARVGSFLQLGWSIGHMILPGIAWLLRDWHYLQLVCTVPYIPLILFWRFIPESPRWLLTRGRIDEAEKLIKQIMKINKCEVILLENQTKELSSKMQKEDEEIRKQSYTFLDLFRKKKLFKITFLQYIVWLIAIFTLYGLTFNVNLLRANIYLIYFVFGLIELLSFLLLEVTSSKIGRKSFLIVFFALTGIFSLLSMTFIHDSLWLCVILAVLAKLVNTGAVLVIFIYTTELYPTVFRKIGISSCLTIGRIGAISAPFLNQANDRFNSTTGLPFAIMGVLNILAGLLILLLPETRTRNEKSIKIPHPPMESEV